MIAFVKPVDVFPKPVDASPGTLHAASVAGLCIVCIGAVALAGAGAIQAWLAALVSAVASLVFAFSRRKTEAGPDASTPPPSAVTLEQQMLPVWERQLSTVREHGNRSAAALAVRFEDIVRRLDSALNKSRDAVAGAARIDDVIVAVNGAKAELRSIVASLEVAQRSKAEVIERIEGHTTDIAQMAVEVRQIAMQISLLSLNAAIEAARAGVAGAPFGVVVREMRQLASRAAETGDSMTRRVATITESVETMTRDARSEHGQRKDSIEHAEATVGEIIDSFAAMTDRLGREVADMQVESDAVRSQIEEAMVEMQYQDRVSQIIAHVVADIERFRRAGGGEWNAEAADKWFEEMTSRFSTPEEFANLTARRGASARTAGDITYFP